MLCHNEFTLAPWQWVKDEPFNIDPLVTHRENSIGRTQVFSRINFSFMVNFERHILE